MAWQLLVGRIGRRTTLVVARRDADRGLRGEVATAVRAMEQGEQQPRDHHDDERKPPQARSKGNRRACVHVESTITIEAAVRGCSHGVPALGMSYSADIGGDQSEYYYSLQLRANSRAVDLRSRILCCETHPRDEMSQAPLPHRRQMRHESNSERLTCLPRAHARSCFAIGRRRSLEPRNACDWCAHRETFGLAALDGDLASGRGATLRTCRSGGRLRSRDRACRANDVRCQRAGVHRANWNDAGSAEAACPCSALSRLHDGSGGGRCRAGFACPSRR